MPKKPKRDKTEREDNWESDQKEREYYYDDAHGYEIYKPEDEEPEDDPEIPTRRDAGSGDCQTLK